MVPFESHRKQLIGIAYRLTGSLAEAEDIVHETYIKWHLAEQQNIHSEFGWLARVSTNLALDHLKSARVRRESYVGQWLPEPFIEDKDLPPNRYLLDESLSIALMLMLENLSPAERVSFVLHDIFQYDFKEIAEMLDHSDTHCRKLASRARQKLHNKAEHKNQSADQHYHLTREFISAIKTGDHSALMAILHPDVTLTADGGGKASALPHRLCGNDLVTRFFLKALHAKFAENWGSSLKVDYIWFNGAPGIVVWIDNKPVSAFNFDTTDNVIINIYAIRNPDKLKYFVH